MPIFADRVKDTTTTTGTGTITVSGTPATAFAAFSTIATGSMIEYAIIAQAGGLWETGRGAMVSGTTFSRDEVYEGSSGIGVAVSFGAGTKDVWVDMPARMVKRGNIGRTIALAGRAPLY